MLLAIFATAANFATAYNKMCNSHFPINSLSFLPLGLLVYQQDETPSVVKVEWRTPLRGSCLHRKHARIVEERKKERYKAF